MSEFLLNSKNYKTYFAWDKYSNLDKAQREELIRFSVEQIRKEKGLNEVEVEFFQADSNSRGSCSPNIDGNNCIGHTLKLNMDILDDTDDYYMPYGTFNTINHELEHASQFELASDRSVKSSNPVALEQRLNDQHYYNASGDQYVVWQGQACRVARFDYATDYQMYRAQACEADARVAGLSAVEGLKVDGQNDPYLDAYLKTQKAREINNNRVMMSKLGMHSREEMAKEELQYISTKELKEPDRQRVLEYARQKDFEVAREVLNDDSKGMASEEELQQRFDNDQGYANFYKSQYYNQNKVKESEHDLYVYAKHKWEDSGEEDYNDLIEPVERRVAMEEGKESFSIWQRVKGAAADIAMSLTLNNALVSSEQQFMTTAGYNVKQAIKLGTKVIFALAGVPYVYNPSLEDSIDGLGRVFDYMYARKHPDEVINLTPQSVQQELVDKNTLILTDPSDPYGSAEYKNEMGDEDFFIKVEREAYNIEIKEDAEFFEQQQALQDSAETIKEDRSFFEKVEQGIDDFGEEMDEKLENVAQTIAETTQGIKKPKQ